jgi:hypothetical protein
MIFTAGLSNLAARSRSHRNQHHRLQNFKVSKFITTGIALSLSSSLLIGAPSFCWLSNVFFRLPLMVLDFGRVINLT